MKTTVIFAICMFMSAFAFCEDQKSEDPKDYVIQVSTSTTENPPSISFKWNKTPEMSRNYDIKIYRKSKDSNAWGDPIRTLTDSVTNFTDYNIEPGVEYEYKIHAMYSIIGPFMYVSAGVKCREVEYRGKIILLVDSTFIEDLKPELVRYESDLIGDGWEVLRKDISRNASVKYVKSIILDFYNSDPENVNTVFLFGHIPVPYSGNFAFDGHDDEHKGAWPADMYYGHMNETRWKDVSANATTNERSENNNVPGDGKFDFSYLPVSELITLSVGRVDLYNLPAFPQSETELLRNYLNKNHAFRHKIIEPKMRALVTDSFPIIKYPGYKEVFSISGWRNFAALLNFRNIEAGDFFQNTKSDSYIWSYACGGGTYFTCKRIGCTTDFVNQSPQTVFTAFYGSRFGDWDSENNFMRAALASKGWILTTCWAGRPHYTFHQMGMGETIGNCVRATQNNTNNYFGGPTKTKRGIHISLLGDPSLRMHIVRPASSLKSSINTNQSIILSWNKADDNIIGYYIYKLDTLTNKYYRITDSPVTQTRFEDVYPEEGNNYYMVRSLKLNKVVSGSYYNLSQGVFDTIRFEPQITDALETDINEAVIYPNPSTGIFNITFGSQAQEANLKIYDLKGRLLHSDTFNNTSLGSFDIGALPKGIYVVKGVIDNNKMITKICLQ